jgi:hypothetical protein
VNSIPAPNFSDLLDDVCHDGIVDTLDAYGTTMLRHEANGVVLYVPAIEPAKQPL